MTLFIRIAVDEFSFAWVRDAMNEAARRNKLTPEGIADVLKMWKRNGHATPGRIGPPSLGRVLRSSSH